MKPYTRLENLVAVHGVPSWRPVSWGLMGFIGLFLIWSLIARFDEVAVAAGEVVPQGRIKTIQHLEGGIIEDIYVRDGDIVRLDTPLVQINLGQLANNRDELQIRLDGLLLAKARLEAEAGGKPYAAPAEIAARQPKLAQAEEATYRARQEEFTATRAVLEGQVVQRQRDVGETNARLTAAENSLTLARERLAISQDLLKDGLTSKLEHSQIQSQVEAFNGEAASMREAAPRARAALGEAQERVKELSFKFSREAQEFLGEAELNIARTKELLTTADDQETRSTIKSPITGIVKNSRYHTIGGVVRPGEAIMDIVPSEDDLVVEAKLNPVDRGFVRAGQKATVKIDTFDYARYGGIEGEVVSVAPDSTVPENAMPYFKVVVRTEKPYLGNESEGLAITPGMGATVDIHTGTKSVMSYLVKPVLKLKSEAFRER
ncbi:MAG: HlyD family type I secretion periplasmic adaptor subunit [Rhodospirillaceae bacterium]